MLLLCFWARQSLSPSQSVTSCWASRPICGIFQKSQQWEDLENLRARFSYRMLMQTYRLTVCRVGDTHPRNLRRRNWEYLFLGTRSVYFLNVLRYFLIYQHLQLCGKATALASLRFLDIFPDDWISLWLGTQEQDWEQLANACKGFSLYLSPVW